MVQRSAEGPTEFIGQVELNSTDPHECSAYVAAALRRFRVVRLTPRVHLGELRSFYDGLVQALGTPIDIAEDYLQGGAQTGDRWMEVRFLADVDDNVAYRYSRNGQPLHTDESYIQDPCDVMAFYCVNRAAKGGETLFVDGLQLIEKMQQASPDLLDELYATPVSYAKANNRRRREILRLGDDGSVELNYNYYCIADDASAGERSLNQRFFDFLQTQVHGTYLETEIGLNPGEGVLWWDRLVLHGRRPFFAEKDDDRLIWKTGFIF